MNRNSRLPGMAFTPLHRLTQVGCLASFGDADLAFAFALAAEGKVLWLLGLGMAACNLTGARLGGARPEVWTPVVMRRAAPYLWFAARNRSG